MTRLLVLRPQPGADATVGRAKALGLDAVATPLFEMLPIDWDPPDPTNFDAVLLTSANAVRMAGDGLSLYLGLPVYAVGDATARAAQGAGFGQILAGEADGAAIVRSAIESGNHRLLHLAGRDHIDLPVHGTLIERRIVYASEAVDALPDPAAMAMRERGCALLHSVRAAQLFAALTDAAGLDRLRVTLACLSPAICAAAGAGWARAIASSSPTDEALLAIAARLCDQGAESGHRPRAEDRA